MRKAIFLSIEGLGTNLIGAYGNSLTPTPSLDLFAAKSVVLDQLWSDSPHAVEFLESIWTGTHAHARSRPRHETDGTDMELPYSMWREALRQSLLVTDSLEVAETTSDETFEQVIWAEPTEEAEGTQLEQVIQAAVGLWEQTIDQCPILWIHSKGLRGRWDAPQEYRQVMCDEGDPEPTDEVHPVGWTMTEQTDPDDVFRIACAVGGEAISIDETWRDLMQTLTDLSIADDCLVVLLGTSGYPLGEHRYVGGTEFELYAELLHVPCMMRFGNCLPLGLRTPEMLQPHDFSTWLDLWFDQQRCASEIWTDIESRLSSTAPPKAAFAKWQDQAYVATTAWSYRTSLDESRSTPRTELFSKPDDRWEQNEVSSRATHVSEKFAILKQRLEELFSNRQEPAQISDWLDDTLVSASR